MKKRCSVKRKLKYHFMVHDNSEELLLEKLIKGRRFGLACYENNYKWTEYFDFEDFRKEFGTHEYPYTIRVYFNGTAPSLLRFREKRARLFPLTLCGNHDCDYYLECEFSPDSIFNKSKMKDKNYKIEYIWRCIARDEYDYKHDPAEE